MKTIGIIMNGVTGRMGTNQHLIRSIQAIREQGGVRLPDGRSVIPKPLLLGRNQAKIDTLAARIGGCETSTDIQTALSCSDMHIYFDAQTTNRRVTDVTLAIAAGKHIYCEKPTAVTTADALKLHNLASAAGICSGVVQDKLYLPGLLHLKHLVDTGFFGRILSIRGEFGYWVFTGHDRIAPQRPSWNYRAEDGGGIITDMLCHWRYVLDHIFAPVTAVSCLGATHIPERIDENGQPYTCTADDSCYATFTLEGGIVAHFNSSWTTRVKRDDLVTIQVDGTHGSAVAGLRECRIQPYAATPKPVWNPDIPSPINYYDGWTLLPQTTSDENGFKVQWEMFIRHVLCGTPWKHTLLEGAKGVQLAECGIQSWRERRWIDIDNLSENAEYGA